MKRSLCLAFALVCQLGCETNDRKPPPESAKPAPAPTAPDDGTEQMRRAKDEFVSGAQRKLDDLVRRSEQLGADASAKLLEKRKQTEALLRDARDQAGAKWDVAKGTIGKALSDLESDIDQLRAGLSTDGGR